MTPETVTLISGVLLLLVFAVVGWRVRRRDIPRGAHRRDHADRDGSP